MPYKDREAMLKPGDITKREPHSAVIFYLYLHQDPLTMKSNLEIIAVNRNIL